MATRRTNRSRPKRSRKNTRRLNRLEQLEQRQLLASDWLNSVIPRDANSDGVAVPQDALIVINELNDRTLIDDTNLLPSRDNHPDAPLWDVNGDHFVTGLDALIIINALNDDVGTPTLTARLRNDTATGGGTNDDGTTSDPTIRGRALDALTGVATVEVTVGSGNPISTRAALDGSFSIIPNLALDGSADGTHIATLRASDGRGNLSPPVTVPFVLDTTAPDAPSGLTLSAASDTGVADGITANNEPNFDADAETGSLVRLFVDGTQVARKKASSPVQINARKLADGQRTIHAIAEDVAGNRSLASDSISIQIDSQSPSIALALASDTAPGGVTNNDLVTSNPIIVGSISDASSLVSSEVQVDGGELSDLIFEPDGSFTFDPALASDGSADGTHLVTITATDVAGNPTTSATIEFTLDTVVPLLTLTDPVDAATLTRASHLSGSVADGTSEQNVVAYQFDDGAEMPVAVNVDGTFVRQISLSGVADGAHTLTVHPIDQAGNAGAKTTLNVTTAINNVALETADVRPADGGTEVGVTFRPQIFFTKPIDPTTIDDNNFFMTASGTKINTRVVPANDGSFAWLFPQQTLPAASTLTLHVDGDTIATAEGEMLDADGNGQPGGALTTTFTTVSLTPIPGTLLTGLIFEPGPDDTPGTADDLPIVGAEVSILGINDIQTTDANGRFTFDAVPAGNVKVLIDGMTATAPDGLYYPEMVMDSRMVVGATNFVMPETETTFVPRLMQSILNTVDASAGATIVASDDGAPQLPPEQRNLLQLEIAPNSLVNPDGTMASSSQIGISTVPSAVVRDMLPPGVLQHTFDITVQAPGLANFSQPVPITFPNVFGAAPGTQLNFLSFDHTTGRLEIEGTATVSMDGLTVRTDPDTGLTHPGWAGLTDLGARVEVSKETEEGEEKPPVQVDGSSQLFLGDKGEEWTLTLRNKGQAKVHTRATFTVELTGVDKFVGNARMKYTLPVFPGSNPAKIKLAPTMQELRDALSEMSESDLATILQHGKVEVRATWVNEEGVTEDLPEAEKTFYLARLFSAFEDVGKTGLHFSPTINDGSGKAQRIEMGTLQGAADSVPMITMDQASESFSHTLASGELTVTFDPQSATPVTKDTDDTAELTVKAPDGQPMGKIPLSGTIRPTTKVFINEAGTTAGLAAYLQDIIDGNVEGILADQTERELFDTAAERSAIATQVAEKIELRLGELSDTIEFASAPGDNTVSLNWLTAPEILQLAPLSIRVVSGDVTRTSDGFTMAGDGVLQIGLSGDGFEPLLEVDGSMSADGTKISGDGTVSLKVGRFDGLPLFDGTFEFARGQAKTSKITPGTRLFTNPFTLAGLNIVTTRIELTTGQVELQGGITLPGALSDLEVKIDGEKEVLISDEGINFTGGSIAFPDDPFVILQAIGVINAGVSGLALSYQNTPEEIIKIQGKLTIPELSDVTADFSGDNFIQIKDGKVDVVGELSIGEVEFVDNVWELEEATVSFNTLEEEVRGEAEFKIPKDLVIIGGIGFKQKQLNFVKLGVNELNKPIGTTGAFLQRIDGAIDHIASSDPKPILFTGGVGVTYGPEIEIELPDWLGGEIEASLLALDVSASIDKNHLEAEGTLTVAGLMEAASAQAEINWNEGFVAGSGTFNAFLGAMTITQSIKADTQFNVTASGSATGKFPEPMPLAGGFTISSANVYMQYRNDSSSSNDYIAVWQTLNLPVVGETTAGLRVFFNGDWETIGGKTVATFAAGEGEFGDGDTFEMFDVPADTPDLLLSADWENATTGVEIIVRKPDGTVLQESDIASDPNIAIVDDFSNDFHRAVSINAPEAGAWSIQVVDATGLGQVTFSAMAGTAAPTVSITAPVTDSSESFATISYIAADPDSDADLTIYVDNDRSGFDGIAIRHFKESDGPGDIIVDSSTVAPGEYYAYAVIDDGDNAPVMSEYSVGKIVITDPDAPDAVANVASNWLGDNQVELSWDPVDGANYYIVDFTDDAAGIGTDQQVTTEETSIVLSNEVVSEALVNGETYRFDVRAVDAIDRSGALGGRAIGVVGAQPTVATVPGEFGVFGDPGTTYTATITPQTGDSFELIAGPVDATIDSSTGAFSWNVPADQIGFSEVVVHRTSADGTKEPVRFVLYSDANRVGSVAGQVFFAGTERDTVVTDPVGLNDVEVELVDAITGLVLQTMTTVDIDLDGDEAIDAATERGRFAFGSLTPGNYLVRQTIPALPAPMDDLSIEDNPNSVMVMGGQAIDFQFINSDLQSTADDSTESEGEGGSAPAPVTVPAPQTTSSFSSQSAGLLGESKPSSLEGLVDTSVTGDGVDNRLAIRDTIKNSGTLTTPAARRFDLASSLNQSLRANVAIYVDSHFNATGTFANVDELVNALATTAIHEIGHTYGAVNTGILATNADGSTMVEREMTAGGSQGRNDVMFSGQVDESGSNQAFLTGLSKEIVLIGLGGEWENVDAKIAREALTTHIAVNQGNALASTQGDSADEIDEGRIEGPFLQPFDDAGKRPLFDGLTFSQVAADGAGGESATQTINLTSLGTEEVVLQSVSIEDPSGSFTVGTGSDGTTVPVEGLPLTINFDPLVGGDIDATLVIASNDPASPHRIPLSGSALSASGDIRVDVSNNNVGGHAIGASTATTTGFARINNIGGGDLTINSLTFDANAQGAFELTTPPALPLVIVAGGSAQLDLGFNPDTIGLHRGELQIGSDDPDTATVIQPIVGTGLADAGPTPEVGNDFYAISTPNQSGSPVFRGRSDAEGGAEVFLPPDEVLNASFFDPITGLIGLLVNETGSSGPGLGLPIPQFLASTEADDDGDGLPNDVEDVIGTSKTKVDTDGNGVSDFAAIQQGLDPLGGRAFPTGIIGSLTLPAQVRGLIVEGSTLDASTRTAYIANDTAGLSIVDITQPTNPLLITTLQLPGTAHDVDLDSALGIAAVATGNGLQLVDVSDPMLPTLRQTVDLASVEHVEVFGGMAFITHNSDVVGIDLVSGAEIARVNLGTSPMRGFAREGSFLYAMSAARRLHVVDASNGSLTIRGTLDMQFGGGQIFVGNDIVYVVAASYTRGGFSTVDVSAKDAPALISNSDVVNPGAAPRTTFAANGSGLGLLGGRRITGSPSLEVYDITVPDVTDDFVTRFPFESDPRDVEVAGGFAFVGTANGTLQVVNYLGLDSADQPPTVSITSPPAGSSVVEGAAFSVQINAVDDVQVRNVALLVDGDVVATDVSFPFDLLVTPPLISSGTTSLTLQVRATDTGGNAAVSSPVTVDLIEDTQPPTVLLTNPTTNERTTARPPLFITFNEAIAAGALDKVTLTHLGVDATAIDDTVVAVGDIQTRFFERTLAVYPTEPTPVGPYRLTLDPGAVTDGGGNTLAEAFTLDFSYVQFDAIDPPKVSATSIAPNASVASATSLVIDFDATIDASRVLPPHISVISDGPDALFDTADDVAIPLTSQFNQPANQLTLTFGSVLTPDDYRVTLDDDGFIDTNQNKLDGEFDANFPTGDDVIGGDFVMTFSVVPPRVTSTSPSDSSNVREVTSLTVGFDRALSTSSVTTSDFVLVEAGPGSEFGDGNDVVVPIDSVESNAGNDQLTISPDGQLSPGKYQLTTASTHLQDANNVELDGDTDGAPGGSHLFSFIALPPSVSGATPSPNSTVNAPAEIVLDFAQTMQGPNPDPASFLLVGDGDDGGFGTGDDDVPITITSAEYNASFKQLTLKLAAALADDTYRFTAPASELTDPTGATLDGDFSGNFPTGDGLSGGNFVYTFQVETSDQPPLAVVEEVAAGAMRFLRTVVDQTSGLPFNEATETELEAALESMTQSFASNFFVPAQLGNWLTVAVMSHAYHRQTNGAFMDGMDDMELLDVLDKAATAISGILTGDNTAFSGQTQGGDDAKAFYQVHDTATGAPRTGPFDLKVSLLDNSQLITGMHLAEIYVQSLVNELDGEPKTAAMNIVNKLGNSLGMFHLALWFDDGGGAAPRFTLGDTDDPTAGSAVDRITSESRLAVVAARARDEITSEQFSQLIETMIGESKAGASGAGTQVAKVPFFGTALEAFAIAPYLSGPEQQSLYGADTLGPLVGAQIETAAGLQLPAAGATGVADGNGGFRLLGLNPAENNHGGLDQDVLIPPAAGMMVAVGGDGPLDNLNAAVTSLKNASQFHDIFGVPNYQDFGTGTVN